MLTCALLSLAGDVEALLTLRTHITSWHAGVVLTHRIVGTVAEYPAPPLVHLARGSAEKIRTLARPLVVPVLVKLSCV